MAALAACGGGSGTTTPAVQPVPSIAPVAPTPTPTPSPYPSTSGESFAYSGTLTQQYALYGTPAPAASPGATPEPTSTPWVSTSTQSVSQNVVLHGNASFNGTSGLTELETNETDAAPQSTYTIDSKQYVSFAADSSRSNGIDLMQMGIDATDSNGVHTTTTFAGNGDMLDQLPQVPASQWNGSVARSIVENDPSGESLSTTYAGDGTYTASATFPEGTTSTITEFADGSGAYVLPFIGVPGSEITISPVESDAINITFKAVGYNAISWGALPVWYPSVPPVLAGDAFADSGTAQIPASCNVPSSIGTQALRIDESRARIDSIYGELEKTTQSAYVVPGYGDVCVVTHDDLTVYYDYSGESAFLFSGTPLRHVVTDETLGLTKATLASSQARTKESTATVSAATFFAPSMARMQLATAKNHLRFVRRMTAAVKKEVR